MKSNLFSGCYLFHLHTSFTDGILGFDDYFRYANEHKIDRLIFLEHIRREPNYDVSRYLDDLKKHSTNYNLPAYVGFEAKILPGGEMDISDSHASEAEVVGMAEHGFPDDFDLWFKSVNAALERYQDWITSKHLIWVHPGLWLKKKNLLKQKRDIYFSLLKKAITLGWYVERNFRYDLIPQELATGLQTKNSVIIGADAHKMQDLDRWLQRS